MEKIGQRTLTNAQLRKIKKPLIERRRRERINDSLNQLKTLLLDALHKDEGQSSKMEKADILELAVDYLKSIKTRSSEPTLPASKRYQSGYAECAQEVGRYLANRSLATPTGDPNVVSRVNEHLSNSLFVAQQHARALTGLPTMPLDSLVTSPTKMTSSKMADTPVTSTPTSVPLYVDISESNNRERLPQSTMKTEFRGHCSASSVCASGVSLLSIHRSKSFPRAVSPNMAMEAPEMLMLSNGHMKQEACSPLSPGSPIDLSVYQAQSKSPVWRPW